MKKICKATVFFVAMTSMPFAFANQWEPAPADPGFNGANLPANMMALESCQCVAYVRNRLVNVFGISAAASKRGDAYLWGANLQSLGFSWFGAPRQGAARPGDVVVFQPQYQQISGSGVDKTYGHIAFVESASYNSSNQTWTVTYFGANQGTPFRTDQNCSNVSTKTTTYKDFVGNNGRTVSFYFKP